MFFFEKEPKNSYLQGFTALTEFLSNRIKVFCFFFFKKEGLASYFFPS